MGGVASAATGGDGRGRQTGKTQREKRNKGSQKLNTRQNSKPKKITQNRKQTKKGNQQT